MLKIFRKIRRKLLAQHKIGQYLKYAVGEIILVVIGILIALQINNWNQSRIDRNTEKKVLTELKEDMTVNLERMESLLFIMHRQREQVTKALTFIKKKEEIPQDSLRSAIRPFYNLAVATFDPMSGTIDDILNADKLTLIRNRALRRKLSDWHGLIEDIKEEERKILHIKLNTLQPYMNSCCPMNPNTSFDLHQALSDFRFENILLAFDNMIRITAKDYGPVKEYIEELIQIIEDEFDNTN